MTPMDTGNEVERLPRELLGELQAKGLRKALQRPSPFVEDRLASRRGTGPEGPGELSGVPLTSREDLLLAQLADPPWGGLLAVPATQCSVIGFSGAITAGLPGREAIALAATAEDMASRVEVAARALSMGGSAAGDRTAIVGEVARSLLHHVFLGALARCGSTPFQTGRGLTLRHVRHTMPSMAPTQLVTHPTYALFVAELLEEEGAQLPVHRLFLWGETGASVPTVRAALRDAWHGATVRDVYAMEELGVLAAECEAEDGLHGFEDRFVYEVFDPETEEPLAPGDRGELVVTALRSEAMPFLRYRTGDLVMMDDAPCPCGRTHARLTILGRVVPTPGGAPRVVELAKVERLLARHRPLVGRYRVVLEDDRGLLEVPFGALDTDRQAIGINSSLLAAKSSGLELRPVSELAEFRHRSIRIVREEELDWWEAVAEEQRRLEE